MLQRNPHPYALVVPDIPATVQPGDTIDWPLPLAGFEPAPAADEAPTQPKKKSAAPVPAAPGEEQTP